MTSTNSLDALNQSLVALRRSLPMYLVDAVPWTHRGSERAEETLAAISADVGDAVDRIGALILDEGGATDSGEFPMKFTGMHDLSIDYLIEQTVIDQQGVIEVITQSVDDLRFAPSLQAVAQEALGMAKGHLQSLEELAGHSAEADA